MNFYTFFFFHHTADENVSDSFFDNSYKYLCLLCFRNVKGHRGREWTDSEEAFGIVFEDGKTPTCRNRANHINGRLTKALYVQRPVRFT